MTTIDATGNPVIQDNWYGYTQSSNGITNHIIGKCTGIKEGKLNLSNIRETSFVYISSGTQTGRTSYPTKTRTVSSVICFPIDQTTCKEFPKKD